MWVHVVGDAGADDGQHGGGPLAGEVIPGGGELGDLTRRGDAANEVIEGLDEPEIASGPALIASMRLRAGRANSVMCGS